MFKVKVGEDEYEVEFEHYNPASFNNLQAIDFLKHGADFGTDCIIFKNVERHEDFWKEGTILHPLDQHSYNKNTRRKLSLTRALQQAFPGEENKELRGVFWMEYYKARGGKW